MQPVFLITDVLLFALVLMVIAYAWHARRHEPLRAPWREVARHPLGMSAAVVLMFFVIVALLDSIHFKPKRDQRATGDYGTEILSAFDVLVYPLKRQVERSYSAPFAAFAYAKETLEQADGHIIRSYSRLRYGGAHLGDPRTERATDIALRLLQGLLAATAVWAVSAGLLVGWLAHRQQLSWRLSATGILAGRTPVPWRAILAAFWVMAVIVGWVATLGPHYHVLGTDKVGSDVLYQALKSIRTGLIIGTLTTLVTLPLALLLGVTAGYFRGWIDDLIQYCYTTLSSIPGVLLIAAAALILDVHMSKHVAAFANLAARADLRLFALCVILGVTSWTGLCRLLRGEVLKLREIEFVDAARALGVTHTRVLLRHLVPNVMHIVMISVVLDFSGLVLAEAVLTYINIGVDPSMESWGNMINSARLELAREPVVWWSLAAAFTFMFVLVLAANLFADAVRDAFDPRLRTLHS